MANYVGEAAARVNVEIAYKKPYDSKLREVGRDWPSRAESMIGLRRMENIQYCVQTVLDDDVPGDLIEAGVWRGGACIFMKANLLAPRRHHAGPCGSLTPSRDCRRRIRSSTRPTPATSCTRGAVCSVGADQVRHNFERYGVLDERVKFLVGWFKDTLPTAPIETLSLMRLDGDMYESTWRPSRRCTRGCRRVASASSTTSAVTSPRPGRAVHDYRGGNGIDEEIVDIDGFGAFWRKRA